MIVSLIGYRGTGKTETVRRLALRLGWAWTDSDVEVEFRAGKSIASIFADQGEDAFRELECRVVDEVCRRAGLGSDSLVLAVGGGAVLREENSEALAAAGPIVWLTASPKTILARLAADPATPMRRPALTEMSEQDEIEKLLARRLPIYRRLAALHVDTEGKFPDDIVEEIVIGLGLEQHRK